MKQAESSKVNKQREKTDEKAKTSKRQVTVLSGDEPIASVAKEEMLKSVTKTTISIKTKVCVKYRTYRGRVGNSKCHQAVWCDCDDKSVDE